MKQYIIGIDIGGTKCAVLLGLSGGNTGREGLICDKLSFPTETEKGWRPAVEKILDGIAELAARNGIQTSDITAAGISCGSPLDAEKGIILNPPNLYGWDYVPIADLIYERFGIRAKLENDANACAVAEWKFGAGAGTRNMVFLTFGTGMGAGLILDGRLYSGTSNSAGEVGHMRLSEGGPVGYGKAGSFEGFCSGGGLAQLARGMVTEKIQQGHKPAFCPDVSALDRLSAKLISEYAVRGDELAKDIFAECGRYLGRGLALIVDMLNPEAIVIGSIYERSRELLEPFVMETLRREALPQSLAVCRIVPAGLGDAIGDYAALSLATLK